MLLILKGRPFPRHHFTGRLAWWCCLPRTSQHRYEHLTLVARALTPVNGPQSIIFEAIDVLESWTKALSWKLMQTGATAW